MSLSSANGAAVKAQCPGFEPQQWRRSVCKHCFRSAERHSERRSGSPPETEVVESADSDHRTTEYGKPIRDHFDDDALSQ